MKKSIFLFFAAFLCAVGMNAETYRYSGEKDSWAGTQMTVSADGYYSYYGPVSGAHQFKIGTSSNQWAYNHSYVSKGFNNTDIKDIGDWSKDNAYCWSNSSHYILVYHPKTTINSGDKVKICASTFLPDDRECYLMGVDGDWNTGIKMMLNSKNSNEFILLDQPIKDPIKFKVKGNTETWTDEVENYDKNGVDWKNGNIVLPAGNYDFYFKKDKMKVYIARNTVVTTTANPAEGGTLTGAGVYNNNDDVTLTATANDGYNFVNWTKGGTQASADATYAFKAAGDVDLVANFELKTYTVEFLNYDGEVLQSSTINHGETPVYSGKTPERPADAQYTYTFSDWDNAIAAATSDQTYKAQFNTAVNQYTITVNAENGTVTGAGTYDYGTSVTLTAEAADGYKFTGWSNDETANPYIFTVTEDITLTANFKSYKVTPTVVENAYFSVGNNKYVQFSTGNLQYEVGTNTWSFASKQYEVIGGAAYDGTNNTNYGMNEPGYTGKLDLFGWSSDGKFGVNPSNTDDHYGYAGSDFVDWGELVNETGWYTLTKEEMNHILARTKDGKKLWALATVCGMNGLILLPDNWNTSITLDYGYVPANFNYTKNQIDADTWQTLETAGAVFLPEGGSRVGGHGNKDNATGPSLDTPGATDAHGDYFHVDNVGEMGYYWLNTQDPRETHKNCASFLILPGWDEGPTVDAEGLDDLSTRPQVWSREKRRGNSVRLVKEVKPDYTREGQGAGVYGTVCYPKNIVWVDGATLYEVAGKEGNKVIFDEVTTPEAGMPYIFIADQEVINFFCGEQTAPADNHNSLHGTFEKIVPAAENALTGNYVLYNNIIKKCGANCGLEANRAYFVADELENSLGAPSASQAPGRRRISLDVQSENTTTDLENIINGENTTIKVIENGQLIIICNGEKFNAQGVRF